MGEVRRARSIVDTGEELLVVRPRLEPSGIGAPRQEQGLAGSATQRDRDRAARQANGGIPDGRADCELAAHRLSGGAVQRICARDRHSKLGRLAQVKPLAGEKDIRRTSGPTSGAMASIRYDHRTSFGGSVAKMR